MATFCSRPSMFDALRKPGRNSAKPANISAKIANTIACWLSRPVPNGDFIPPHSAARGPATHRHTLGHAVSGCVHRQARLLKALAEIDQVLASPLVGALLVAATHGRRDLAVGVQVASRRLRQRLLQQRGERPVQQAERLARHHQRAVLRRPRDQRMERRVELPVALDARGVGLAAHRFGRGRQVVVDLAQVDLVGPLRRQARRLGLDDHRHLPQLRERHLVQDQRAHRPRRQIEQPRQHDEQTPPLVALEQALLFEHADRFTDRRAVDAELRGQLLLGRQRRARLEITRQDVLLHHARHRLVGRLACQRAKAHRCSGERRARRRSRGSGGCSGECHGFGRTIGQSNRL